ncbi:MAG: phenylacetate-CoA oxygenase subunit PaaJ [Ignavibacteria bacterium]|nr:phenylacetate-CoA oxygenase subunit PaaJ [Ignavibacteria bacterium]
MLTQQTILNYLSEITDPEIPVLNIVEMGIVRNVSFENENVCITVTPTYSGCPAMKMIEEQIVEKLQKHNCGNIELKTVYAPAWTTDWLSEETKMKLRNYGIAPPSRIVGKCIAKNTSSANECPYCHSANTDVRSEFGSTSCKSVHYCNECMQPFEMLKEI